MPLGRSWRAARGHPAVVTSVPAISVRMALQSSLRTPDAHDHVVAWSWFLTRSRAARVRPAGVELVVRLQLDHPESIDLERVPGVLVTSPSTWLGEETPGAPPGMRSFLCDLELQAGGRGPTLFRKAAVVSLAEPARTRDGWVVPIEWRAASLTPLFPVFAGQLQLGAHGVRLDGRYAPPGGRMGYVLDVALLGAAARQTGRWFLRRLAAELS
jgi:hypothetical protein